jgi:hypothetical protein
MRRKKNGAKRNSPRKGPGKHLPQPVFDREKPLQPLWSRPKTVGSPSAAAQPKPPSLRNKVDGPSKNGQSGQLADGEAVLADKRADFVARGKAWGQIRDSGSFGEHRNFSEYSSARWGIKKTRAYQLIGAAEFFEGLRPFSAIVENRLPECESHLRPLVCLSPPFAFEVWKAVVQTAKAEGKRITAPVVEQFAAKLCPDAPARRAPRQNSWAILEKAWRSIQRENREEAAGCDGVPSRAWKTIFGVHGFLQQILNANEQRVQPSAPI